MEWSVLLFAHLFGLALCVGSATGKVVLLLRCRKDSSFTQYYLKVVKPLTRILVVGLILMTLSGIIWLILGYGITKLMIIKLILVGAVWVLGILIDNVTEPQFLKLAPAMDQPATEAYIFAFNRHLAMEVTATLLFYIIMIIGIML